MRPIFFILIIFVLLISCVENNSSNKTPTLYQTWILDSASIFPVIIPSFCDSLYKGALLTFTKDNKFIVHNNGDTCGEYYYTFDSLTNTINVAEFDMIFSLDSVTFSNDKLEMKSDFTKFPHHSGTQHLYIIEHGNHLFLKAYKNH